jgi:phosphate acetyltransferase
VSAFLEGLRVRARRLRTRIGFPEATEPRTIEAIRHLVEHRLVQPVAIGEANRLADVLGDLEVERLGLSARGAEADSSTGNRLAADSLEAAVALLAAGDLDGVVAGAERTTGEVIRMGLQRLGRAAGLETVSSSFYMVLRTPTDAGEEVLTFTDPGVVPLPSAAQLAESAEVASRARRSIVGDEPRVAFLSYSTAGSAAGEGVERVREGLELFRRRCPDVPADGELQVDAALEPRVAARKAPDSPIAGRANVLVFPSLDAANIAYKLVERLAGARALGPILQGFDRPLNDLSRGASVTDIVEVACITALMANGDDG